MKLTLLLLFLAFFMAVRAQQNYTVEGNIAGVTKERKIFLEYRAGREFVKDSVITENGKFTFNGTTTRPLKANLILLPMELTKGFQADSRTFYLSSGLTSVSGSSLKSALIKGGKAQDDYMELTPKTGPLQDSLDQYTWKTLAYSQADKEARQAKLDTFKWMMDAVEKNFIEEHKNSYVSLDLVGQRAYIITDPQRFEVFYNALGDDLKNTDEGKKYAERLALVKRLVIGQPAIDFSQNDPDGKPVSLASLRGKYVLIDFWASWCGPCRMEYPYLLKAYSKFKDKNFEIIGVSLDDKELAWVKSIKDNGFPWLQVCDLKGFKNEVALAYGIAAIPQSFLIDPNGIIIAKNLRGNNLIEKLNEVIKPQ